MEKTSLDTKQSSFSLFVLPHVLVHRIIILWVLGINRFFTRLCSSLQSLLQCHNSKISEEIKTADFEESSRSGKNRDDGSLCIEEMEMVMERLGFFCSKGIEEGPLEWFVSGEQVLGLFESKEPSLEEVREAFDAFDFNRDGFIDAMELQRVLCSLGFKEGLELGNCRRMIKAYDQDGDGLVDFKEFFRFMEGSFC
ncbi:hypothetical protein HS088_TW10G00798 [Tripterygium wilfordii]|uniref:EF-hand domain-containing protein n=1 Tax=Tripterygium wilfordii TaxID=458696 RepID=A0A7J7D645_TRIWF|nr:hypothetical protein HS088_TW10G00798 [Tripterygium wilfordii]